jgi:3-oxoadipate enol-lactonase
MPQAIAADGVPLHYALHDHTNPWEHRPTVLLQHGFGRSGKFWFATVPALARHYRVLVPDFRGLGQSGRDFDAATGINAANYLSDLRAILDHAEVERVHYVGESIGGTVGYVFAAQHPERVATLSVLASPTHINPWMQGAYAAGHPSWPEAIETLGSAGWAAATNTAARFPADMDPRFLAWYSAGIGEAPTAVLAAMARFALTVDVRPLLPRIQAPLLALFPAAGRIATEEQQETLRASVPNLHILRLATHHHMIQMLDPGGCNTAILQFLGRVEGRPPHE